MGRLKSLSRGGRLVVALAVGGALFGIASAVQASIPDSGGVIHACYKTAGGQVRLVNSASDCGPSETATQWNQTGPKGGTGAKGATGPTGISGYQVVTAATPFDNTDYKTVTAVCPAGKQILGGGAGVFWQTGAPTPHPKLISSFIFNGGWYGEADDGGAGATWYIQAQAICANAN